MWFEHEAGPLVRPYAVTRGRTSPIYADLDLLTLVTTSRVRFASRRVEPEYAAIIDICDSPLSIAEVAAKLHLPLTVAKVLVGDLISDGALIFRSPSPVSVANHENVELLRAVLDGIQRI
ncbi:DUF742 domain-containing protein [Nocardia sp. CY41]|uniref:DUF742 domain-containing protein n=1 Tax=Nocardia sp. CY41 TaxID=2608686 RepID=UPI002E29B4B6|nr:DUF742 domain-containing protein [Nocardia sp. CY41]